MNLFQNFANSLKTGISQQMAGPAAPKKTVVAPPVAPVAPVAPPKAVTPSNPSAVTPAIKSPAAQAYVASQVSTPQISTPQTATPQVTQAPTGTNYTPTPGYVDSPGTPSQTNNPAMDQYISAYKKYIDAQTNSSELTEARKYLNTLILDDKKAREKALNSGETMGFAGGEEARVARNNAFAIDAATNNVNSLEAEKENAIASAKGGADLTSNLLGFARDDSKTAYQMQQDKSKATSDAAKTKFDQDMATKKFDEDVRQFGIETALKNRQIKIDEVKAGAAAGGVPIANSNLTTQPGYKTLTAKQKTQADSLNNLVRSLNEYKTELSNSTGPSGINLFGKDAALLQTKINSIIFAAAQAEGTGALQQADREVIEQIIPNPTNLGGAFNAARTGGKEGEVAKIDDQISKYTNNLAGYGLTPLNPPATGGKEVTAPDGTKVIIVD